MKYLTPFLVALFLVGCTHNPNVTTPAGKANQAALAISTRVGELQEAAISANASGGLSDADAVTVVKFTVAAQKTLKATPDGWRVTVQTGYTAMKLALSQSVKTKLAVALATLDALLGV